MLISVVNHTSRVALAKRLSYAASATRPGLGVD